VAQQPETRFRLNQVKPALEAIPQSWWVKIQAGSIRGVPDVIGTIKGKFVALELKTEDGWPDELQLHRLRQIKAAGGYAAVVRPSNLHEIIADLEALLHS
jgi:hypothetical protein